MQKDVLPREVVRLSVGWTEYPCGEVLSGELFDPLYWFDIADTISAGKHFIPAFSESRKKLDGSCSCLEKEDRFASASSRYLDIRGSSWNSNGEPLAAKRISSVMEPIVSFAVSPPADIPSCNIGEQLCPRAFCRTPSA